MDALDPFAASGCSHSSAGVAHCALCGKGQRFVGDFDGLWAAWAWCWKCLKRQRAVLPADVKYGAITVEKLYGDPRGLIR